MDEVEVTPPAAPPQVVLELLGRDGRVQWVQRVGRWPARIGRSPACEVVLDDPHVAAEHAELDWSPEGGLSLRLLPSRNGGLLDRRRLSQGEPARIVGASLLQLGGQSLRLRSSADTLADEQPLARAEPRHGALLPALLVLMLLQLWVDRWSSFDPETRWIEYVTPLLAALAFVLGWAGLWALASQLFQHRFPFAAHLRRVLLVICVTQGLEWLLPGLAYALSWPRLLALESLVMAAAGALLVWWHARLVWPGAQRILGAGIAVLMLLGLGLQVANRLDQQYLFGPPYMATLAPPALRLATAQPPQALIDSLRPLQAELARQAKRDNEAADAEAE